MPWNFQIAKRAKMFASSKIGHRSESPVENFSKKIKKNKPIPIFSHKGPKKGVESEYDVHFGQTRAKKIRTHF